MNGAADFIGFIEATAGRRVSGWCIRPDAPMARVELVLLLRGIPVERGVTDQPRPDVAAHRNCHPDSGFAFMLEAETEAADIQILPIGADAPLPRLAAPPPAPLAVEPAGPALELDDTGWVRPDPFPFD